MTDNSHTDGAAGDPLASLLRAELATLQALSRAVDEEHEILLSGKPEALEDVTSRKRSAAEAHGAQQQRRLAWMQGQGLPVDARLGELPVVSEGSAELRRIHDDLANLAQDCFERNRRNGGLIVRLQDRTRSALDVLRREESSELYSLSGARERSGGSRSLGKA